MIQGEKVYLKSIESEDLNQLMEWRNSPYLRRYFREYREINLAMQQNWYNKIIEDKNSLMFSIFESGTDKLIGCCGLCYINWVHRYAELSIYIGVDNIYIDESGSAKETCRLLFNYGFNELNLHKIWSEIYEFDLKKKELYESLGFSQDGVLRDNYFHEGKWWHSIVLSLLSSEFY